MVLVDAAATAGILEPSDRLVPSIAEAGRSWSNLASRWGDLAPPGARLDAPLARAAAEVRAAFRQITHNTTTLATPEVIATRAGLPQASAATLRAIEAGSELAHVVAEKADAPNLTGPARALSRRAHNDVEAGLATPQPDGDVVWVSPADILAKRPVPVPRPVRRRFARSEYGNRVRCIHRGSICHARARQPRRPSPSLALAFSVGRGGRAGPALDVSAFGRPRRATQRIHRLD